MLNALFWVWSGKKIKTVEGKTCLIWCGTSSLRPGWISFIKLYCEVLVPVKHLDGRWGSGLAGYKGACPCRQVWCAGDPFRAWRIFEFLLQQVGVVWTSQIVFPLLSLPPFLLLGRHRLTFSSWFLSLLSFSVKISPPSLCSTYFPSQFSIRRFILLMNPTAMTSTQSRGWR